MKKILFFYAPWCPPCRFYENQFISQLEKILGKGTVQRVNVQEEPFKAEAYRVNKLPSVILTENGTICGRYSGAVETEEIAGWFLGT